LKLAALLAQFLKEKSTLNLAGIGTFSIDAQHPAAGIGFVYNASVKNEDELISFISSQTGKMKPLASSDLLSYIELGLQFLNIGKPFQIEGIGTLVKIKNGVLDFTADHVLVGKVKESGAKELSATSVSDDLLTTYETLKPKTEKSPLSKKFFLVFLAVITTAIIIWISYRLNQNSFSTTQQEQTATEPVPVTDSTNLVSHTDTLSTIQQTANNNYRFVIEVANKKRAFYRYYLLKNSNAPIQMSTTDSTIFKLFFVLPATPGDTARIADSLTTWYPSLNKRKTFVEK